MRRLRRSSARLRSVRSKLTPTMRSSRVRIAHRDRARAHPSDFAGIGPLDSEIHLDHPTARSVELRRIGNAHEVVADGQFAEGGKRRFEAFRRDAEQPELRIVPDHRIGLRVPLPDAHLASRKRQILAQRYLAQFLFGRLTGGVVADGQDVSDGLAIRPENRLGAADGQDLDIVGAANAPAGLDDALAVQNRARQRQFVRGIRLAILAEELEPGGVFVGRNVEMGDAVDFGGGPVDEGDAPLGIGDDDAFAQLAEKGRLFGGDQFRAPACLGRRLMRLTLLRPVPKDLEEAATAAANQRHDRARTPEAGSVLSHVPALVGGTAGRARQGALFLRKLVRQILLGEEDRRVHAEDFVLSVAQKALGAAVPGQDLPGIVDQDDRVFDRAVEDEPRALAAATAKKPVTLPSSPRCGTYSDSMWRMRPSVWGIAVAKET